MAKSKWAPYPHDAKGFAYAGDALKKAWPQLHAGDAEPFPDAGLATAQLYDEPFVVAVPATHPLASREAISTFKVASTLARCDVRGSSTERGTEGIAA